MTTVCVVIQIILLSTNQEECDHTYIDQAFSIHSLHMHLVYIDVELAMTRLLVEVGNRVCKLEKLSSISLNAQWNIIYQPEIMPKSLTHYHILHETIKLVKIW